MLLSFAALILGYNLNDYSALTEHEIVVAGIAKQMVRDGTWGALWIGDVNWLEKPPLPHWLGAIAIFLIGERGEWVVRLPSVLAALAVVAMTASLSARWFGVRVGLASGLMLATSYEFAKYARLAENDMSLDLLVVGAIFAFARFLRCEPGSRHRGRWRLFFWALLGATNLSKGPLFGALFVVATVLGWLCWHRDWRTAKSLVTLPGLAAAAAITLAWPFWVLSQGFGEELVGWWGWEMGGRLQGSYFPEDEPFWYYPLSLLWELLPWTPLLLIGLPVTLRRAWRGPYSGSRFLLCWALLPLIILSIPSDKSHHYILHILPPFAVMTAIGLERTGAWLANHVTIQRRHLPRILAGVAVLIFVTCAAAALYVQDFRSDILLFGSISLTGCLALAYVLRHRTPMHAALILLFTASLLTLLLYSPFILRRDPSAADKEFLLSIDERVPAAAPLFVSGGQPVARHTFYIQRPVIGIWKASDIETHLHEAEVLFVVTRGRDEAALAEMGKVTIVARSERARFNQSLEERYTLFRVDPPAD